MKIRDSGMPEEKLWNSFFDVEILLEEMLINETIANVVEIGAGYGTFTLPVAKIIKGKITAFEYEDNLVNLLNEKSKRYPNIEIIQKDVLLNGTDLESNSIDYVMLFNILHHEKPSELLLEAYRILKPDGIIGIIHWRSDIDTPRGPALDIRPTPDFCIACAKAANYTIFKKTFLLEPYHYGIVFKKNN